MRIRSVKPVFLRHEKLQELEMSYGDLKPMLTFEGLWMVADREGRFEWKPNILKLDILPFVPFDISLTMNLLHRHKFIFRYEVGGKAYGCIPTFVAHQRPNSRETKSIIPSPPEDSLEAFTCMHVQDKAASCEEGKGKGTDINNGKGTDNGNGAAPLLDHLPEPEPLPDPPATAHHVLTEVNVRGIAVVPVRANLQVATSAVETCRLQGMTYCDIAAAMLDGAVIFARAPGTHNWYSFFANALFLRPKELEAAVNGNGKHSTKAETKAANMANRTSSVFDEARSVVENLAAGVPDGTINPGVATLDRNPQRLLPRADPVGDGRVITMPAKAAT